MSKAIATNNYHSSLYLRTHKYFSEIYSKLQDRIWTEVNVGMKVVVMDAGDGDDNGDDAIIDAASMEIADENLCDQSSVTQLNKIM